MSMSVRPVAWVPLWVVAALSVLSCSDSEPIIRSSTFLPVYRYELTQDSGSPQELELAVSWQGVPTTYSVRFSGPAGITGLLERDAGVVSISSGSELSVASTPESGLPGAFQWAVGAEIAVSSTGEFLAGDWTVIAANDTILVQVVPGQGGVDISLNGRAPDFFAWSDFAALFAPGSEAPGWQQAASASFQFLQVSILQVRMVFAALVDTVRVSFTNTPDVQPCGAIPGVPLTGVMVQGERVMTWLGSADLGYDLRFTDCWMDLPGSGQDYLYRGAMALTGWRASGGEFWGGGDLISIGFGGNTDGERVPGGVSYLDLDLGRTVPIAGDRIGLDPAAQYSVSGGFAILFVAP